MSLSAVTTDASFSPRPLDGSEAARRIASLDFGGMAQAWPLGVVHARTVADVVAAVQQASQRKVSLAARGQGHSTRGQALAAGGIVVDLSGLHAVRLSGQTLIAEAGARWNDAFQIAVRHGLTPAVMTDFLGLSVGGTLSVGGFGGQSFRHGLQTDQVEELTVVTGRGDVVTCSSTRVPELFDACRAGLGQCGIIVEARLRLLTAPAQARVHELRYPDLPTLLADQLQIAEAGTRVDYMLGGMRPGSGGGWAFSLELAKYLAPGDGCDDAALLDGLKFIPEASSAGTLSYTDYVRRLDYLEATTQADAASRAAHPWMDLLLPAGAGPEVIAFALSTLDPTHFADGHVMTYVVPSGICNTPLVDMPGQRFGFLFDVLPTVPSGAQARLESIDRSCRSILGLARSRGARVYPIGFPVGTDLMVNADWRAQFGGQYQSFADAKRTFDPGNVLTPGPGVWGQP